MSDNWASPGRNTEKDSEKKPKQKASRARVLIEASNIKVKGNVYVGATGTYFDNREGEMANAPRLTLPVPVKDEDGEEDDGREVSFTNSEVGGDLYQKLKNVVVDNRKGLTANPILIDEQPDPNEKTQAAGEGPCEVSSVELKKCMYQICEDISDSDWLKFARTQLELDDSEIDRIEADYRHSVEERKYQMLRLWMKKNAAGSNGEQMEKLKELRDRFWRRRIK